MITDESEIKHLENEIRFRLGEIKHSGESIRRV